MATNITHIKKITIGTPVRKGIGVLKVAESHTGINFTASATILSVSASVYGVK